MDHGLAKPQHFYPASCPAFIAHSLRKFVQACPIPTSPPWTKISLLIFDNSMPRLTEAWVVAVIGKEKMVAKTFDEVKLGTENRAFHGSSCVDCRTCSSSCYKINSTCVALHKNSWMIQIQLITIAIKSKVASSSHEEETMCCFASSFGSFPQFLHPWFSIKSPFSINMS